MSETLDLLRGTYQSDFPIEHVRQITQQVIGGSPKPFELLGLAGHVVGWIGASQAGALAGEGLSAMDESAIGETSSAICDCIEACTGSPPERSGPITNLILQQLLEKMLPILLKLITDRLS